MDEFTLIKRFFTGVGHADGVVQGVGDDAAVLDLGGERLLLACVDTMVAGVHFPEDAPASAVGHKALHVNLSDIAAMGGTARYALLSMTLPDAAEDWLTEFAAGLRAACNQAGVALVGGDTTRGPLSITVQVLGEVGRDACLLRRGARVGDDIWISGAPGEAALGLRCWLEPDYPSDRRQDLLNRLHRPTARLALGERLARLASACIDVSDGVSADLGHILERSGVGACLNESALPLPGGAAKAEHALDALLFGGDDYELLFTAPPAARAALRSLADELALPLTAIGVIEAEAGLRLRDRSGACAALAGRGYRHFQEPTGS